LGDSKSVCIFVVYYRNKVTNLYQYQTMLQEEKKRYSEDDLKEFEVLISQKLGATRSELNYIKEALSKRNDSGTDNTSGNSKLLEDGADTSERESLSQLAARLQKFTNQLELALVRIKNGTYGVCVDSGKLIPKERLRAVPHTQQTIEAKLKRV
jgi:DnaK suppressor protein